MIFVNLNENIVNPKRAFIQIIYVYLFLSNLLIYCIIKLVSMNHVDCLVTLNKYELIFMFYSVLCKIGYCYWILCSYEVLNKFIN